MKAFIHHAVIRVSLLLGSWPIRFFAWWIATGYFLFRSSRRRSSIHLYQVIFPERSAWYYLYCAWRQFHSYAATFVERIEIDREKGVTTPHKGKKSLQRRQEKGTAESS